MKSTRILLLSIAFYLFGSIGYSQSCNTSVVPGAAANYLFNNNLNDATTPAYNLTGTGVYSATAIEGSNSLNLAGTTNVVQNTTASVFTTDYTVRTVSAFFKANNPNGSNNQYIYEEGGINNSASIRFDDNGDLVVDMAKRVGTNNRNDFIRFTDFPDDGEWHHVAYTYDGPNQTLTLYVDGYPVGTNTIPATHTIGNGGISIGNNNDSTKANGNANAGALPFNGLIDDFALYTRVLTPKQIADIAACANIDYIEELTPMNCTNKGFLVQQTSGVWYDINIATGEDTQRADDSTTGVNSIGYNELDQRIWGYDRTNRNAFGRLVVATQLPDGSFSSKLLGPISNLPSKNYFIGDVNDGKLYLSDGDDIIHVVDVDRQSSTYLTQIETITLNTILRASDFAINPKTGIAYAIIHNTNTTANIGNLIQIDLNPGVTGNRLTDLGSSGARGVVRQGGRLSAYGAVYFDSDGFFYGSNNDNGEIVRLDLRVDPGTDYDESKTVKFSDGPASDFNDGAFCVSSVIALDFGDAPDSYATTIASNGARHIIGDGFSLPVDFSGSSANNNTPQLMLGSKIDRELNASPTVNADGDDTETNESTPDNDAGEDEDAITDPILIQGGNSYTINVGVTNTTGTNSYLSAWVDFNRDGDFGDAGEQIANDQVVPNNETSVDISGTAPDVASGGDSYARFRICDSMGACNTFNGPANSGEVEDYTVTLIQGTLLPVELISFTAEAQGEDAVLEWATATELNNDKFELEYSLDGINFEQFAEVVGQGTTKEKTEYAYNHNNIGSTGIEQVFYRLRQVDFDGTASFSEIRVVVFASVNKLVAYPVPAEKGEQIVITGTEILGNYKVINMRGSVEFVGRANSNSVSISTDSLSSGTYMILFETGEQIQFIIE